MTRREPSHPLLLCGSLILALLGGCQDHSSPTAPPEPTPVPAENVSIFIGGQCRASTDAIVCRDASRSEPANRITFISWELISNSTGLSQGSTPSPPGGEISFTGLAPDNYQVNQTVSAQGGAMQQRTYGPFNIGM